MKKKKERQKSEIRLRRMKSTFTDEIRFQRVKEAFCGNTRHFSLRKRTVEDAGPCMIRKHKSI